MRMPHIDDLVRLTKDIPELELSRGELGVVRSTWCSPYLAFEVEFSRPGQDFQTRCPAGGRAGSGGRRSRVRSCLSEEINDEL